MRTHGGRPHSRSLLVVIGALVTLIAASCGGSDGERTSDTTRPPEPNTERPEGDWTFALWTTSRSDVPDLTKGDATESRLTFDPACAAGPCDIAVTANGADGTARPEGMPSHPAASPFVPYELTWDDAAGRYNRVTETPIVDSCITAEGQTVEKAYEVSRNWVLEFRPPEAGRPASLNGTFTIKLTSTPEGAAANCPSYEESGPMAGAPTDSLLEGEDPPLAHDYVATLIVGETERPEWGSVGNSIILQAEQHPPAESMKIDEAAEGFTMTGLFGTQAPLTRGEAGWEASVASIDANCGPETPVTETFSALKPLALTADGAPVLTGTWTLAYTRTPAATEQSCDASSESGYLVLVPAQAVDAPA